MGQLKKIPTLFSKNTPPFFPFNPVSKAEIMIIASSHIFCLSICNANGQLLDWE